ncbi:MAG TPA: hypothetical protein VFL14_10400 [Xanthomonadales bacterium]|nr:hypothetical protein [Xanthomonadales bacterium]
MQEDEKPDALAGEREPSEHALPTERMPGATTPTWEIELLVSGAVVFSLLQMPGALDTLFQEWSPRLIAEWLTLVFLGYVYLKAATLALVCTFIGHLITRGYWVALVGLRSVYPDGIRWDKIRNGPNYRTEAQRVTPRLIELIDAADNFASLIFAFGAMLVLMTLMSFLYVVPALGVTMLIVTLTKMRWDQVFFYVLAVAFAPLLLAMLFDNFLGKRVPAGHWTARMVRAFYRVYNRLPLSRLTNGMMLTFTSNVGARKGTAMVVVAIWAVVTVAMYSALVARGSMTVGNYEYFPDKPGTRLLDPRHYERTRTGGLRYSTMPFIDDDIAKGTYLRLFVPYDPNRHGYALESRCDAGKEPEGDDVEPGVDAAWRTGVLACIASLQPVWLDDERLKVDYEFATDGESELRGMIAHIRIADLAPGRHELRILRLPVRLRAPADPTDRDRKKPGERPDPPYRIPFWR